MKVVRKEGVGTKADRERTSGIGSERERDLEREGSRERGI